MSDKNFSKYIKDLTSTQLKAMLKDSGYIDVLWRLDDIEYQASEDGVCLTTKEIKEVAEFLERKHDANIGINWDTISYWIEYVIEQRCNNV